MKHPSTEADKHRLRAERLAEALRENLKRRKAQIRKRQQAEGPSSRKPPEPSPRDQ